MNPLKNFSAYTEQYADEAAFLWLFRHNALVAPNYDLADLAELDERLEANIDGLKLSGEDGWICCENNLFFEEPGEIFAASVIAIGQRNKDRLNKIFAIAVEDEHLLNAIVDAFVWFPFEHVKVQLDELYTTNIASKQYVAIAAYAEFRQDAEKLFNHALTSDNPLIQRRVIQAVAELKLKKYLPGLLSAMAHDNEAVQFSACWAATIFGNALAMEKLKSFLLHPEYADAALPLVIMQKDVQTTNEILRALFAEDVTKRLAIKGLAYLGNTRSIDAMIDMMAKPETARIAGEAFSWITGLDLSFGNFETDAPEGFDAGPSESENDDNVDMDPDEDLPWPNQLRIKQWWQEHQQKFDLQKRYISGQEMTISTLQEVLKSGKQRQRSIAALNLAVYQKETVMFNIFLPAVRQKAMLAGA